MTEKIKERVFSTYTDALPYLIKNNWLWYWQNQKWVSLRELNKDDVFPNNMPKQLQKMYMDQHCETTGEMITLDNT